MHTLLLLLMYVHVALLLHLCSMGGGECVSELLKTFLPIGLKAHSLAQSDGNTTQDGSTPIPDERCLILLDRACPEL